MNPDSTQLVRDAQADRPGALNQLIDHWLPVVLRWCHRLGGPGVPAEDAAQEAFETMMDRLHTLQSPDAFPTWLFGITRRTLARHRRRAWLRRWVPGIAAGDAPDPLADPVRSSEQAQVAERVWRALGAVAVHHREVLVLCDLEERADSEVAALLDIPKATVKSHLRRAREALRGELADLAPTVLSAADVEDA